jgi:hypothetical protein
MFTKCRSRMCDRNKVAEGMSDWTPSSLAAFNSVE